MAKVKVGSTELTLPVFPLPGQALGTVGVALGYGRGANGENIGKAAFQTKEYGGYVTWKMETLHQLGQMLLLLLVLLMEQCLMTLLLL